MKQIITEHRKKIELIQWAVISGVASLVYSEYIRRIQRKTNPVELILVPEIHTVQELLKQDGQFMELLSERLIDDICSHELFMEHSHSPELILFGEDKKEIMKTIFDLYITPNIGRMIPDTIETKFNLRDESQQVFRQSGDIDLFDRESISNEQLECIVEQIVIQMLLLLPTMQKDVEVPEDNYNIQMVDSEILTIRNDNAISPIHFSPKIINWIDTLDDDPVIEKINKRKLIDLLLFVTSTSIQIYDKSSKYCSYKNDEVIKYSINTSPFNQVSLTTFKHVPI